MCRILGRCCAAVLYAGVLTAALCGCERSATQSGASPTPNLDHLRSLPYAGSAPAQGAAGVVVHDAARSCPGVNLYAIPDLCRVELMDESGHVLKIWEDPTSRRFVHAELLSDGDLLVVGVDRTAVPRGLPPQAIPDEARFLLRLDWTGQVRWRRKLTAHHDVERAPQGGLAALTFNRRAEPRVHPQAPLRDDCIVRLSDDGELQESLSIFDAIAAAPELFPLKPVAPSVLGGPPWVDLFHSNSLEWMHWEPLFDRHPLYNPGNVLVCFRHQDRIAIFDVPQRRVVWSWGAGELDGPHDAQVLASGNILLFDNGLSRGYSRALEVDPLRGVVVWKYQSSPPEDFYTASKGSVQRLPNGNTLLAESDRGRAFEVTPAGEIVWEFRCPHEVAPGLRAAIIRMNRYPRDELERLMTAHGD